MYYTRPRDTRHGLARLAAALLPLMIVLGCSSAQSGHAPGVAGGETLTPGITNYPLAYVKQPVPAKDIDVRDLITSITGSDLYVRTQASAGGEETNVTQSITMGQGAVRQVVGPHIMTAGDVVFGELGDRIRLGVVLINLPIGLLGIRVR